MDAALDLNIAAGAGAIAPRPQLDGGRVRDIVLVRLACAGKTLVRAELARELFPMVSHLSTMSEWMAALDRDLGALADAGLCDAKPASVTVSDAGAKRATLVLGVNVLPRTWTEAKGARLVAKALGAENIPLRRQKSLLKAEGLKLEIVQSAFKLKSRGMPSASKLRSQLAKLAVTRAFGDSLPAELDGKSGLAAKAGRALAGRFANPPREFATDSRLITALAMEQAGAAKPSLEALQTALLRRYVTRGVIKPVEMKRPARIAVKKPRADKISAAKPALKLVPSLQSPPPQITARPDFESFVAAVRHAAMSVAEGWSGNRKAYVSRVWAAARAQHPHWQVSDIEFKAMLVEAHRVGRVVLATIDLKDEKSIADVQASAIAYKNTIFHIVRVDE